MATSAVTGGYEYMKEHAVASGEIDGLKYLIVESPSMKRDRDAGLNGYLLFPKRPTKTRGFDGILTYVPVHGGITYATETESGMLYGFDTAHCDSQEYPILDHEWIKGQIDVMMRGIVLAASLEDEYLLAEGDNEKRAEIADRIGAIQPEQKMNTMALLNALCGSL